MRNNFSFFHRFFEIFSCEDDVLKLTDEGEKEAIMETRMLCPKFIHTFELIQAFTEDFTFKKWKHPLELRCVIQYSYDVYKVFWKGDLKFCEPTSFDLVMYKGWFEKSQGIV
jgi:hypothetical protein